MYVKSITTGKIYDARIRKICLEQLISLLQRQRHSINKMDKLLESFDHKNRDYIFLINGSCDGKYKGMTSYMETVRKSLTQVFDNKNAIENSDRISLITYTNSSKVIFSLVERETNFTQLRNQVRSCTIPQYL